MKKYKFFKAAVIMFTILYAFTGVLYADNNTSKFIDIDNNWAKQHIMNVYDKGLMGGFSETEFKPGEYVKNYDALVSISRMINQEKNINLEQLEKTYQKSVLDKFNVPVYARGAIALCLEEGIVTDADISKFGQIPYATKNSIIEYLGKAFGIVYDEKAPPVALEFLDVYDIPTRSKPCVKFLLDNGILSPYSETNTKLYPKSNVDRAVFAKMMDISSDVYNKKVPVLDTAGSGSGTEAPWAGDIEWAGGIGPGTVEAAGNAEQADVIADVGGVQADVVAYVDQVIPEYGNLAVFVGTERRVYKIAENAECTIDDIPSGFWKLSKSDRVKLFIEKDKVVRIMGESKIRKTVGTLISIESNDKSILKMKTASGDIRNYTIMARTIVIKDGKSALWQELKEGNSLVVTTSYDELIEINADGVKSSDKGIIESLTYSRIAPPKIVITALDGRQNTYYANDKIEIAGAGNDVHSLRPGMQAEVSLIDDEIKKITIMNENALIVIELKGVIKSINLESRLMVIEVYDNSTNKYIEKKVYITEETKMQDADFNPIGLNSLKINQIVTVRGTGMPDGVSAKTIQVAN